jgi:hypothetical protein
MVPRNAPFNFKNFRAKGQSRLHAGNVNKTTTNHCKALDVYRFYVHEHSELTILPRWTHCTTIPQCNQEATHRPGARRPNTSVCQIRDSVSA